MDCKTIQYLGQTIVFNHQPTGAFYGISYARLISKDFHRIYRVALLSPKQMPLLRVWGYSNPAFNAGLEVPAWSWLWEDLPV